MRLFRLLVVLILFGFSYASPEVVGETGERAEDLRLRANKAFEKGEYILAQKALNGLLAKVPGDKLVLQQRAGLRILLGDAEGAEEDFDALMKFDQKRGEKIRMSVIDSVQWIARKHASDGEDQKAVEILDVVIELLPFQASVYHERGSCRLSLKNFKGAISDFDRAIELSNNMRPWIANVYHLRAQAKRGINDFEGAKRDEEARDAALKDAEN